MWRWLYILLLCLLALFVSGCDITTPASQDDLLVSPKFAIQAGAPYCENEWPYTLKSGALHIHTILSNTPSKNFIEDWFDGDKDHLFGDDLTEITGRMHGDFFATADHGEKLTPGDWLRLRDLGKNFNIDNHLVFPGFEWTSGGIFDDWVAHIAVYGTEDVAGAWIENEGTRRQNWEGTLCPELADLYAWLNNRQETWVGCFAHPWAGTFQFGNFHLPENSDALRMGMALIEVGGGLEPEHTYNLAIGEKYFQQALAKSFWVSPVNGLDNFGSPNDAKVRQTGVWCCTNADFTREDLLDAFRNRRTFARVDWIRDFRFAAKTVNSDSVTAMGSAMTYQQGDVVEWQCLVRYDLPPLSVDFQGVRIDGSVHTFSLNQDQLRKVGKSGLKVFRVNFVPDAKAICYYLRIRGFNDMVVALSAPIWLNRAERASPFDLLNPSPASAGQGSSYDAEVAACDFTDVPVSYQLKFSPGETWGYDITADSKYPVGVRISDYEDYQKVLYCKIFSRRGERATWLFTNSSAEVRRLAMHLIYKLPDGSWASYEDRRVRFYAPGGANFELDDDYSHDDLFLRPIRRK